MKKTFVKKTINGHQYQLLQLPNTDLFEVEIVHPLGADLERVVEKMHIRDMYGVSHLVEHLGFHDPIDYTTNELHQSLKREGTYNAYTSHDNVSYHFTTISDRAALAVKLVCNYAYNDLTRITQEAFETERTVVCNEIRDQESNANNMFTQVSFGKIASRTENDNVCGSAEVVGSLTLDDAIAVKQLMLTVIPEVICVTYDPEKLSGTEVVNLIEREIARHKPTSKQILAFDLETLRELKTYPLTGTFQVDIETNQCMTNIFIPNNHKVTTSKVGNAYLSQQAATSLDEVIRQQNGLTYYVVLGDTTLNGHLINYFHCAVERGTEDRMKELMQQSLTDSIASFSPEARQSLVDVVRLKRKMAEINQRSYMHLHNTAIEHPTLIDENPMFAIDLALAYDEMYDKYCTEDMLREYMESVRDNVINQNYGLVSN